MSNVNSLKKAFLEANDIKVGTLAWRNYLDEQGFSGGSLVQDTKDMLVAAGNWTGSITMSLVDYLASEPGLDTISPVFNNQSFNFSENQTEDSIIATLSASDNVAVTGFTFTATGTTTSADGYFTVDSIGRIRITAAGVASDYNDYESGSNSIIYNITASDAESNTDTANITLNVTNLDDIAPTFVAQSFDFYEGAVDGQTVATLVASDDVAIQGFVFTATGTTTSADSCFIVNSAGEISITPTGIYSEHNNYDVGDNTVNYNITAIDTSNNTTIATITLNTLDVVTVSLSLSVSYINETGGTSDIIATLNETETEDVIVNLSYSGTAIRNTDYTAASSITITAGNLTGSTTVTSISDELNEGDETIVVDISSVTGGSAVENGTQTVILGLIDDDTPNSVTLSVGDSTIVEDGGTTDVTVTLDRIADEDVVVSLSFGGSATKDTDYTLGTVIPTEVTYQPDGVDDVIVGTKSVLGDLTVSNFYLEFNAVDAYEGLATICSQTNVDSISRELHVYTDTANNGTLKFVFGGAINQIDNFLLTGDHKYYLEKDGTSLIIKRDDVAFDTRTISNYWVSESGTLFKIFAKGSGGSSANNAYFGNIKLYDFDFNGEFVCALDDGWASNPTIANTGTAADMTAINFQEGSWESTGGGPSATSITIPAGDLSNSETLEALPDILSEGDETVILDISGVTGDDAVYSSNPQTVTINETAESVVTLSVSDSWIDETGGTSTIYATLSAIEAEDVIVSLSYSGSATAGTDYATPASSITITAGDLVGSTVITVTSDETTEIDETIIVEISGVTGGNAVENGNQQVTITIADDDPGILYPPQQVLPMYDSSSPFNQVIGSSPTLDENSATMVSALVNAIDTGYAPILNRDNWTVPVYIADADTPKYTVTITGSNTQYGFVAMLNVPIPDHAAPDSAADGHMTIIDVSTGYEWDFWQASKDGEGNWSTSWGNRISISGDGIYDTGSGCKASGFANMAGIIWPQEFDQGHIDHALFIALPIAAAGGFVFPATSSDGWVTVEGAIPEGAHLQLDPNLDLDALGITGYKRTICEALQTYGAYVGDYSGAVSLYAICSQTFPEDPYPDGTYGSWSNLTDLPWEHMRVLAMEDPHWGPTGVTDYSIYQMA